MSNQINIKEILKIINEYCIKNRMSLAKYSKLAGVSKSWLSRLMHENEKKISLQLAEKLLNVAGYTLKITKQGTKISYNRLRRKHG